MVDKEYEDKITDQSSQIKSDRSSLIDQTFMDNILSDLSDLIISKKDSHFNFNDKIIINLIKAWFPKEHSYLICTLDLISLDGEQICQINVVAKSSWMNQKAVSQTSDMRFEEKLSQEFSSLLLDTNIRQVKSGNFYFISPEVPSRSKIIKKMNTFEDRFRLTLETVLLPKIAQEYCDPNEGSVLAVKLYDPMFDISSSIGSSTLSLRLELLNEVFDEVNSDEISIDFPYSDLNNLSWIYPDLGELDYQEIIIKVINDFAQKKQRLSYGDIELVLFDYDGLSSREKFVKDQSRDPEGITMQLFERLYLDGFFDDIILRIDNLHDNIKRVLLNGDEMNKYITIGPGGISSLKTKIYDPKDPNFRSPEKSVQILSEMTGLYSDRYPLLLAIYDHRRTSSIMRILDRRVPNE